MFATCSLWILRALVTKLAAGDTATLVDLLLVPHPNKTSAMNQALEALGESVRGDRELQSLFRTEAAGPLLKRVATEPRWADFASQFQAFIAAYGMRSANRDFTFPRWSEDPRQVLELIGRADSPAGIDATSTQKRMAAAELRVKEGLKHKRGGRRGNDRVQGEVAVAADAQRGHDHIPDTGNDGYPDDAGVQKLHHGEWNGQLVELLHLEDRQDPGDGKGNRKNRLPSKNMVVRPSIWYFMIALIGELLLPISAVTETEFVPEDRARLGSVCAMK